MNTAIKDQVVLTQVLLKHLPLGVTKAVTGEELFLIPEIREQFHNKNKVAITLSGMIKSKTLLVGRVPYGDRQNRYAYYRFSPPEVNKQTSVEVEVKPIIKPVVGKPNIQVYAKEDKIVIDLPSFTVTVSLK